MRLGPKTFKTLFNLYPPYFFSRTRVQYIAPDWKEVIVKLKKSLLTRNYVGTTFGGSLYQAADPFYMLMLIHILGIKEYVIWDQSAQIDFLKPARSTITYHFRISDKDLDKIKQDIAKNGISRPTFMAEGIDKEGVVCVRVKKGLYVRKKKRMPEDKIETQK